MLKKIKHLPMEFVTGMIAAVLMFSLIGAAVNHDRGGPSGRVHTGTLTVTDATKTFTTDALDLAESTKVIVFADFTEVSGAAPGVTLTLYSGNGPGTGGGTTGTSFTKATGATSETKSIVDGKFARFLWAVGTYSGTTSTVNVGIYVTGKP